MLSGQAALPDRTVDRHWTLLSANATVSHLLVGVAPQPLEGDVNVLRLGLHPEGLASRILNPAEWRHYVLTRLSHEIERSTDPVLVALRDELETFLHPAAARLERAVSEHSQADAVPLRLKSDAAPLVFPRHYNRLRDGG